MRGALAVALGLIALQWVTSSTLPGLSGALAYPAQLVAKWIDPTVPLISQQASTTSTAAPTSSAASVADQVGQAISGLTTGGLSTVATAVAG